jgi:prevent-host-death family protein
MDVAVSALRANLSTWLDRVRTGEEIVGTDRGLPVARFVPVESSRLLERLTQEGVIGRPETNDRPKASGATRAALSTTASEHAASDLVSEQRR